MRNISCENVLPSHRCNFRIQILCEVNTSAPNTFLVKSRLAQLFGCLSVCSSLWKNCLKHKRIVVDCILVIKPWTKLFREWTNNKRWPEKIYCHKFSNVCFFRNWSNSDVSVLCHIGRTRPNCFSAATLWQHIACYISLFLSLGILKYRLCYISLFLSLGMLKYRLCYISLFLALGMSKERLPNQT